MDNNKFCRFVCIVTLFELEKLAKGGANMDSLRDYFNGSYSHTLLGLRDLIRFSRVKKTIQSMADRTNRTIQEINKMGFTEVPDVPEITEFEPNFILQGSEFLKRRKMIEAAHLLRRVWLGAKSVDYDIALNKVARHPMLSLLETNGVKDFSWCKDEDKPSLTTYEVMFAAMEYGMEKSLQDQLVKALSVRWNEMFVPALYLMDKVVDDLILLGIKNLDAVLSIYNLPNRQKFELYLNQYFWDNFEEHKKKVILADIKLGEDSYWDCMRKASIYAKGRSSKQQRSKPRRVKEILVSMPIFAPVLEKVKAGIYIVDDNPPPGANRRACVYRTSFGRKRIYKSLMILPYDDRDTDYEGTAKHESLHWKHYTVLDKAVEKDGNDAIIVAFRSGHSVISEAIAMIASASDPQPIDRIWLMRQVPIQLFAFEAFEFLFELRNRGKSLADINVNKLKKRWYQRYQELYTQYFLPINEIQAKRCLADVSLSIVDWGLYILATLINSQIVKMFSGNGSLIDNEKALSQVIEKVLECQEPFDLVTKAEKVAEKHGYLIKI